MEKFLLIGTCIVALMLIGYNIKALGDVENQQVKIIGSLLLSFTSLRYITLLIYGFSYDLGLLNTVRYFYYASSIGITLSTALALWYVLPFLKERIQPVVYLLFFSPWIIFYVYLILKQPTQIVENPLFGYELMLVPSFTRYLSIAQGSIVSIFVLICIIGIIGYKHLQIRITLFMVILAQLLLVLDGIGSARAAHYFFRLFTVTEAFALWTICYAFSHTLKTIKRHTKNAS